MNELWKVPLFILVWSVPLILITVLKLLGRVGVAIDDFAKWLDDKTARACDESIFRKTSPASPAPHMHSDADPHPAMDTDSDTPETPVEMDDCPQCGEPTETLHEGYCEDCRTANQSELDAFNASIDWWSSLSDDERGRFIKRRMNNA